jgi:hypothetical protein
MHRNHATEYYEADALLNESISEAKTDDMPLEGHHELRLARIAEYKQEALQKEDPLRANLGAITAGLFEIAYHTETAVINSLQSVGGNSLVNPNLQRLLGTHANLTRQVDRYANLDVRIEAMEQQAENAKSQRRIAAMPAATGLKFQRGRA